MIIFLTVIFNLYMTLYDMDYTLLAPADLTNNTLQYNSAGFAIRLHYFGLLPASIQNANVLKVSKIFHTFKKYIYSVTI